MCFVFSINSILQEKNKLKCAKSDLFIRERCFVFSWLQSEHGMKVYVNYLFYSDYAR